MGGPGAVALVTRGIASGAANPDQRRRARRSRIRCTRSGSTSTTRSFPTIQINYQSIGSGGGIQQVTEGTVDFGATDGPMTDEQLKEFQDKRGFGILHFPTVLGADVPAYNIPGVTAQLELHAAKRWPESSSARSRSGTIRRSRRPIRA